MVEINNKTKSRIDIKLVKRVAEKFLRVYKLKNKDISIAFIGDAEIKKINKRYRGLNKPTDVLSFSGEEDFLGEILIDYNQIKRQAKKYSHTTEQELIFILVHGLLHLIGFDDKTEKGRREIDQLAKKFIVQRLGEVKKYYVQN